MSKDTPMMIQYRKIKHQNKDSVLFFRMGDFYEMFEHDAEEISGLLNITLTKRNNIPMCGIPYHAAQTYISKLLKFGKKIAICEQTHIPKPGKGIALREVVEIITPGTLTNEDFLEKDSNNFLASLGQYNNMISLSYIDLSTSEFFTTSFDYENSNEKIKKELARIMPKEIIIQESLFEENKNINRLLYENRGIVLNRYPDWNFDIEICREELIKQLGVNNLKGFGLYEDSPEIITAGAILEYIKTTSKSLLPHIRNLTVYGENTFLNLDESTQKNLELITNIQNNTNRYTLLEVLDYCKSSMGTRRLKQWILKPLIDKQDIEKRLLSVNFFYHNQLLLSNLRDILSKILDIERLSSRIAMDKAHAKDLLSVKISLLNVYSIFDLFKNYIELNDYLKIIEHNKEKIKSITDLIESSIKEEPSINLNEGNIIKKYFNEELDSLFSIRENAKELLEKLLISEREKTGISSLKLKFNKIIGYFFEVTKTNLSHVPDYFIRKQSLVTGERFTTDTLSEFETKINNSHEKIIELEKKLFIEIRNTVKEQIPLLLDISQLVSKIDVLQSYAFAATVHGYNKPEINKDNELYISKGRHPVVESNLPYGSFIPNDTVLNENNCFILLTGPNMAGKSTYLRQTALIVLMAQIGSFVPAEEARIGIVDKIFCRVGASDNLARGESTFLVEMNETAHILRSASEKSLIIMDEVGRGTSTNDGFSIAWAVSEYILKYIKGKTLFATHYHELTEIRNKKLINYTMDILEKDDEIIFLKKVKKGSSDNSYGIHVAKLAGLPEIVIENARKILNNLKPVDYKSVNNPEPEEPQIALFSQDELVIKELKTININSTTPLEAFNLIQKWQRELKNK